MHGHWFYTFHCEQRRFISRMSNTPIWHSLLRQEKKSSKKTKSCLITISIRSAAQDGPGFKESMCLLQSMNIPKAWSAPRKKEKRKTWSGELRLTLDIATVDPWLDRSIRKCCSLPGGLANYSVQCWKACVLHWDVWQCWGWAHTCKWSRETIKCSIRGYS